MNALTQSPTGTPGTGAAQRVADGYRRALHPVVRGVTGVLVTVAFFAAGGAVGGRPGLAITSVWVLAAGLYCLANFWHCREAHCVVTGLGWTLAAVLGFAAAATPGHDLSWYRVNPEVAAFLVILCVGYGLEHVVLARTGSRALRQVRRNAQDR